MSGLAPHLPGFAAAYAILLVAGLSPGPAVAMLMGLGQRGGRRAALMAAAGIGLSDVVLFLLTLAGIGVLLANASWAVAALRIGGGLYLAWLAVGAFQNACRDAMPVAPTGAEANGWKSFVLGLGIGLTNPKAVVFWIAINAVGATSGGGTAIVGLFAIGAFAISFGLHGAWALLLSSGPVRAAYARARRWVEATLGTVFALFAWRLATDGS